MSGASEHIPVKLDSDRYDRLFPIKLGTINSQITACHEHAPSSSYAVQVGSRAITERTPAVERRELNDSKEEERDRR